MGYISTEASKASAISSFSELSPNDKFIVNTKEDGSYRVTLGDLKKNAGGISLKVVAPERSIITVSDGNVSFTQEGFTTFFNIPSYGTWTVTKTKETNVKTKTIVINQAKDYEVSFTSIYGIRRDLTSSSPEWTRIGDSENLSASSIESDFDHFYPWSEMKTVTFGNGHNNVMVRIPEFWYQRTVENNIETIKIADMATEGFELHPGCDKWVGAYLSMTTQKNYGISRSITNGYGYYKEYPQWMDQACAGEGAGFGGFQYVVLSAIQFLYLVEFATYDSVTTLPDKNYRGITNLFGSNTYIPGINFLSKKVQLGFNEEASYVIPLKDTTGYITQSIYDSEHPWILLSKNADTDSQGSSSTYFCASVGDLYPPTSSYTSNRPFFCLMGTLFSWKNRPSYEPIAKYV